MVKSEDKKKSQKFEWVLLKRFLTYLVPYKLKMVFMYLMTILNVGSTILIPILIKIGIDSYIAQKDFNGLLVVSGILVGALAVLYFSARSQGVLLTQIGYNVLYKLRHDLFVHLQKLSFRFFDTQKTGKIMTRMTSDVQVLEELLRGGLDTLFVDILMLVSIIVVMVVLDPRLSLVLFITIPLFAVIVFYVRRKIMQVARRIQRRLGSVNSFLNESISGIKVIRSFARESEYTENFKKINNKYYRETRDFYPLNAFFWQSVTTLASTGTVLVLLGGGLLLSQDMISIGVIAAFLVYINRFFHPMQKLSNLLNQLSRAMASCERIFEILDSQPDILDSPGARVDISIKGNVQFRGIHFSYNEDEPILHDINFNVQAGRTVAIVGPTGAGKTTIINLICRFYDPVQGEVLVDGHNLRDISQSAYRSFLAIVMQDSTIFSGTVLDNIRYGKPLAGLEEVEAIAMEMGIHQMFLDLPQGYDTEIGERGSSLSLGQKQLIAFSRALIRDPRILILDEASAYIDSMTEQLLQDAMKRLRQSRTTFIIAHRLSTIRDADLILVVDNGKIVESGSHEELMKACGHYAYLLKTQYATIKE